MNPKNKYIAVGILLFFIASTLVVFNMSNHNTKAETPQFPHLHRFFQNVTYYSELDGCYFPYIVKVVYCPLNSYPFNLSLPNSWNVINGNQEHEALVNTSDPLFYFVNFTEPYIQLAGGNPLPLNVSIQHIPAAQVKGVRSAQTALSQFVGEPLGATLADNMLFVEADSGPGSVFAINPITGNVIWYATGLASYAMGDPVVSEGMVYVSVGDVGFNFANFNHYIAGNDSLIVRGMAYGAIYAFNATNGRLMWMHFTDGEAMPSPAVYNGIVAYVDGAGFFTGANATTGKVMWQTHLPGLFASMSSVNYYVLPNGTPIFMAGFSELQYPYGKIVAVNGINGNLVWESSINPPYVSSNTGVGDVPVAVDQEQGIVISDTVANQTGKFVSFVAYGVNATDGKLLWEDNLSYGGVPAAFKGGVPLVVNGVAYLPDPSTGEEFAINASNGKVLWETVLPGIPLAPKFAGAPRGSPIYFDGYLLQLGANSLYVMNASDGHLL